jgi:hypothetical protein
MQTTIYASSSNYALNAAKEFTLANGTIESLRNSTNFFHVKTGGKCSYWENSFWNKTDKRIIDKLPENLFDNTTITLPPFVVK